MATKNDAMILVLQDKIAKKKDKITNPGKFVPVTTCIFNLYGEKVNIHTLDITQLSQWLITFKMMIDTSKTIDGMSIEDVMIDGYNVSEWYNDLLLKYQIIKYDNEMKELRVLENKLSKMLSSDKKVELELAEIAALIGD